MNINDLKIPEEYQDSHFAHKIDEDWYLILNEAPTSDDQNKKFKCWLFNSDGSLDMTSGKLQPWKSSYRGLI